MYDLLSIKIIDLFISTLKRYGGMEYI